MKIVIIGDLHFPSIPEINTAECKIRNSIYQILVESALSEDADYYVVLGDTTNYGTLEETQFVANLLSPLRDRLHVVVGNHDTHRCTKNEFFDAIGNKAWHSVDTPDAKLLFLDTSMESRMDDWIGVMAPEQMDWLKKEISNSDKPSFLFAHHPVEYTTLRSDEWRLRLHADILPILRSAPMGGVYFNGHNHRHSIVERGNWLYIQTGDFLGHQDYRIAEFDGHQFNMTTKSIRHLIGDVNSLFSFMESYSATIHSYTPHTPEELQYPAGDLVASKTF